MTPNDSVKKHSKTRYNQFSISLIVLVIIKAVPFAGGENLCNAPKVVKGSSANISCSFDKNVPRMQENLFLEHLAFSAIDHEIVVFCQVTQGKYACRCKDGYQVVGNVTDVLVVEIREAFPEHAGIYWCGGFESDPLARTHCRLNVMDDLNLNLETTTVPNAKVLLAENDDKQEKIKEDVIIPLMVSTVLPFIIVIIVYITRHQRKRKHVDKKKKN